MWSYLLLRFHLHKLLLPSLKYHFCTMAEYPTAAEDAALSQQGLTHSAEGCSSGSLPENLMQGGHGSAHSHADQRMELGTTDSDVAGYVQPLEVFASSQGVEDRKVLTRLDVFKMFTGKSKYSSLTDRVNTVFDYFGNDYDISMTKESFRNIFSTFLCKSNAMYKQCKYSMKFFTKKHKDWLSEIMISGQLRVFSDISPKSNEFLHLSTRQQLRSCRKLEMQLEKRSL